MLISFGVHPFLNLAPESINDFLSHVTDASFSRQILQRCNIVKRRSVRLVVYSSNGRPANLLNTAFSDLHWKTIFCFRLESLGFTVKSSNALELRLARFVDLDACEKMFVASIQRSELRCRKGHRLLNIGDLPDKVWIIKSGWAVLKSHTKQHGNQILRIYLPGEIIGLSEFGAKQAAHHIVMQTDGVVSPLCRKTFHQRLSDFPRLGSLLLAVCSLNLTAFHEQVSRLNTMCAQSNLKFFLLQLQSRLHAGQGGLGCRFELPMSQVEIGQVLGMTSIYVNKLLRRFVADGQLEIERPYFRMTAREAWETETAFTDAFADMDTSWFATDVTRTNTVPDAPCIDRDGSQDHRSNVVLV